MTGQPLNFLNNYNPLPSHKLKFLPLKLVNFAGPAHKFCFQIVQWGVGGWGGGLGWGGEGVKHCPLLLSSALLFSIQ